MKIKFLTNNYMTIWNLLYSPSISIRTHALKQKLWITYNKEYKKIEKDKDEILCDIKNFIPDDNTLYDVFDGSRMFQKLCRDTEKHRMEILKSWDIYKKDINKELDNVLKITLNDFSIIVIHPSMDTALNTKDSYNIAWGKKKDLNDLLYTLLSMIELSIQKENIYESEVDRKIFESVIHMAVVNEIYTRLASSNYKSSPKNSKLEKALYPYFLMYMGATLDDTTHYMMRDNMPFDITKYKNIDFKDMNILEFIDYLVQNKKKIVI